MLPNLSPITQEVLPDFFSDEFHRKASSALQRVEGMALPNFLAGRAFHSMVCDILGDQLSSRSDTLVECVREFMQRVLRTLCEHACANQPESLKSKVVQVITDLLDEKESSCKHIISKICQAELGWMFTQNESYKKTLSSVNAMVKSVAKSKINMGVLAAHRMRRRRRALRPRDTCGVPKHFIRNMVNATNMDMQTKDENQHLMATWDLQVGLSLPSYCISISGYRTTYARSLRVDI